VASLNQVLAVEWAKSGVCVNAIAPGVFRTELNTALLDGTDRGREFLLRNADEAVRARSTNSAAPRVPGFRSGQLCQPATY